MLTNIYLQRSFSFPNLDQYINVPFDQDDQLACNQCPVNLCTKVNQFNLRQVTSTRKWDEKPANDPSF